MADPTMQAVLARLETLQTKVEAQDAKLARYARQRRDSRRLLPLLAVALLAALAPLSLLAASPFTDLTGGVHDANIDAIYNAHITTGCVPNQQYCPTATVTREEMASFLARLGGLGTNPPVANAKTAQSVSGGLAGWERVSSVLVGQTLLAGGEKLYYIDCPAGKKLLSGGFTVFNATAPWINDANGPLSDTQWFVALTNRTASTIAGDIHIEAICATITP